MSMSLRVETFAAVLDTFGVDGTYQAAGSTDPISLRLMLDHRVAAVGDWIGVAELRTQVRMWRADVPSPAAGDIVTVDGRDWIVDRPDPERSDAAVIACWVR